MNLQLGIALCLVAVSCQPLSVTAMDCLGDFLKDKFKSFDIRLNGQIEPFPSTTSNFFVEGKSQLRDLSITQVTNPRMEYVESHAQLNAKQLQPQFVVFFTYTTKVAVFGKHTTSGTVLAKRPFSGQGYFNATEEIKRVFYANVFIKPTLSEYLEIQEFRYLPQVPFSTISEMYLENISQNPVFTGRQEYLDILLDEIQTNLDDKIDRQIQLRFEAFWQQHISETKLTDICITP